MFGRDVIVAGVDGSEGSRHALRWAVAEAHRTDASVEAITAWSWDAFADTFFASTPELERERAETVSIRELNSVLADIVLGVPIARQVVQGAPVEVLVRAAQRAHLLVLGGYGPGRLQQVALGSVSEACIRWSPCPVVIVPVARPASTRPKELARGATEGR